MTVIALRGRSNMGKSETLKNLIEMIAERKDKVNVVTFGLLKPVTKTDRERLKDMSNVVCYAKNASSFKGDVYAIFNLHETYLCITSQGDDCELLKNAYNTICNDLQKVSDKTMPDIFICAVRSSGGTNDFLEEICAESPVVIYDKAGISTIKEPDDFCIEEIQEEINSMQAQILAKYLKNYV